MQLFDEGSLQQVACQFFVKPYKKLTKPYKVNSAGLQTLSSLTVDMEVKPAEFARQAGVSRASISEKIKKKTLIVNAAGMLDTENPVNAAYLSRHRQRLAETGAVATIETIGKKSFAGETFSGSGPPFNAAARPDDFSLMAVAGVPAREMLNMTLREIVLKYPSIEKIERYSKILKDTTMSAEREQRIQERALTLIPKDFVLSRLFPFLEGIIKQVIEYPEAVADRIIALASRETETTRIEVIETLTKGLTQIIGGAKENIIAELNSLKNKYQKDLETHDQIEQIKDAIEEARNG